MLKQSKQLGLTNIFLSYQYLEKFKKMQKYNQPVCQQCGR